MAIKADQELTRAEQIFWDKAPKRLKSIGLPFKDECSWHNWVYSITRNEHANPVRADVSSMTDHQVVAFVRKHARDNQSAMYELWCLLDDFDDPDYDPLEYYGKFRTRYHAWRYIARQIAGEDSDDMMEEPEEFR